MVGVAGLEPALKLFRKEIDCPLPRLPLPRCLSGERGQNHIVDKGYEEVVGKAGYAPSSLSFTD